MAIPKLIYYSDNSYITDQGTLFEGFETFSDWTKMGGDSIEADSVKVKEGILSLKLNSVNGVATAAQKAISKDFSAVTNFILWIYINDDIELNNILGVNLFFSSTSDWSKYFAISMQNTGDHDPPVLGYFRHGWNRFVFHKGAFNNTGEENWSNTMIRLRVNCSSKTGKNVSVSFDDLRYDHTAKAKCILTFDGAYDNVYENAKPIMDTNGQAGVTSTIASSVGSGGQMTKVKMTALQNAGWDITQYSYVGSPWLINLSQVEMEEEIDNAYNWLVDNGFCRGARFFHYPHGSYNQAVITKVREHHRMARTTLVSHFQPHFNVNDNDMGLLVRASYIIASDTPATINGWIDNTITQGGLLVLLFHRIVESGAEGPFEYNQVDFETISNYLKTKQDAEDIEVITFSDYYDQFMPSDLTSVVYLEHGALIPFPIAHEPSESINRAEDGQLKVYGHPLAGDKKRIWRFKCIIDNLGNSGYKWRDLEYFYSKVVEGAKRRCVFVDANSVQYLVRIIGFVPKAIGLNNKHEVTLILEEDYT